MSPRKTWAVFVKESRHILRDPGTLLLLLLAPVLLMIIFSYALVADIRETPITVIDHSHSALSRQFLATLANSNDIIVDRQVSSYAEVERYFDRDQTKGLVVIPPDFANQLAAGKPVEVQILVDGTDPTTAQHVINHTVSRSQVFGAQMAAKHAGQTAFFDRIERSNSQPSAEISLRTRTWYNPDLKNTHGIVPAMIPIVLSLPAIVVMGAIVREKETGTLEGIFATPLGRGELLVGKLIPYVGAGLVSSITCALVAVNLFGVPFRGAMSLFLLLSTDFLLAAFGMGLLISVFLSSQAAASIIGLLVFLFPSFFLSGIFYPVASFPDLVKEEAQWLPSTHFVAITRGLMVKGQGLEALWEPALILLVLAIVMTSLAVFFFKKRLR